MTVAAAFAWASNSEMLADVAKLGYLSGWVLDVTFGRGTFWRQFKPQFFKAHDIKIDGVDFRHLPHKDRSFDSVVIDGPYKLRGASSEAEFEERYGLEEEYLSIKERHELIADGITECARVSRRYVLVKCQAQVCSGRVWWQDDIFTHHGESLGLVKVDRFDLLGKARVQPPRTRADGKPSVQIHANGRPSTLLVFRKP